jgi:hypothetical protein
MQRTGAALFIAASLAWSQSYDIELLAKHGIEPTRESISEFLRRMFPDAGTVARIELLISQLGDRSPDVRDAATRELAQLGAAPLGPLEQLLDSPVPEVRRRARLLVANARRDVDAALLHAVFRTIREQKLKRLSSVILQAIPLTNDPFVRAEATRALIASVGEDDVAELRRSAKLGIPEVQLAALKALQKIAPKEAALGYERALGATSGIVRAEAARQMAQLGRRDCLPVLVALLVDPNVNTRAVAAMTLRAISGTKLGFAPHAIDKDRKASSLRWQAWLDKNATTATWKTPLQFSDVVYGRTLIALYGKHMVIELDDAGRKVWELKIPDKPWAVWGMPSGHRLITHYSQNKVVEYDISGKPVWSSHKLSGTISSVAALRNGNILVAIGYTRSEILEVGRDPKKTRVIKVPGQPVSAVETPSGNFLVALNEAGAVVTVDRTGKEIRRIGGLKGPYNARVLSNGNILISENVGKRISEWTPDGKKVWEKGPFNRVYTSARLEDGSTLFGDDFGLRKITPKGKIEMVFKFPKDYLYFHRY